jgi:hypothetical protein
VKNKDKDVHLNYDPQEKFIDDQELKTMKSMSKPYDDLDRSWLETEPAYGKEAQPEFYEKLKRLKSKAQPLFNPDGTPQLDDQGRQKFAVDLDYLWDELGFYTRDLRLGNLSKFGGDVNYCEHYLNLAGDCLRLGLVESFTTAYRRVATKLEVSQSKGGFFRKNANTVRSIRENKELDGKKGLFGGNKEDE